MMPTPFPADGSGAVRAAGRRSRLQRCAVVPCARRPPAWPAYLPARGRAMDGDFSLLDRPDILSFMFYPRRGGTPPPRGALDLMVPVGDGVQVHARLYLKEDGLPTVLF